MAILIISCGSNSTGSAPTTEEPAESPDITLQVEGLQGGTAYLIGIFTDQRYRADSAQVDASGTFTFKRPEPYKPGFFFVFLPNNSNLQMLIDKDQTFSMKTRANDLIGSMQVEGSLDNELLYQNLKWQLDHQPRLDAVTQQMRSVPKEGPEYQQLKQQQDQLLAERKAHLQVFQDKYANTLFTKFKMAGQNPEVQDVRNPDGSLNTPLQVYLYRTQFWDNVDFSDNRLLYTPVIYNKLNRYITELTPQNPDSINSAASFLINKVLNYPEYFKYFANWIALQYDPEKTTLMDPQAVFVHMIQNFFTYDRAFWSDSTEIYALQLRAYEMAASLVGKKGPDVQAADPDGRMRSISEIKAPYVVVYMYDPNCDQCAIQTPKLVRFYNQWKSRGVEVFGIVLNTDLSEWKNYIAKNGITWINVFDPTNKAIYAKYYVDHTPEIYVLNPERIIIGKNLNTDQIETVINRDKEKRGGM